MDFATLMFVALVVTGVIWLWDVLSGAAAGRRAARDSEVSANGGKVTRQRPEIVARNRDYLGFGNALHGLQVGEAHEP